jgi:magnesium-transporting ATPase (P-type)
MSVIVKHNGQYKLLIKGADNIIRLRLSNNVKQPFLENAIELLSDFSKIGLRTLMMAMKILSEDEV